MTDTRNIIDYYKYWENDAILADLHTKRAPFGVAMEHWHGDMNIGGVVRAANAFNAREVHYIGKRQWDRRGAVGMHHYTSLTHTPTIDAFYDRVKDDYAQLIAIDNLDGAAPLEASDLPVNSLFIFGEESVGLSDELLAYADRLLYIQQYGAVRSLNASVAAGITMYEWCRQHRPNVY